MMQRRSAAPYLSGSQQFRTGLFVDAGIGTQANHRPGIGRVDNGLRNGFRYIPYFSEFSAPRQFVSPKKRAYFYVPTPVRMPEEIQKLGFSLVFCSIFLYTLNKRG